MITHIYLSFQIVFFPKFLHVCCGAEGFNMVALEQTRNSPVSVGVSPGRPIQASALPARRSAPRRRPRGDLGALPALPAAPSPPSARSARGAPSRSARHGVRAAGGSPFTRPGRASLYSRPYPSVAPTSQAAGPGRSAAVRPANSRTGPPNKARGTASRPPRRSPGSVWAALLFCCSKRQVARYYYR